MDLKTELLVAEPQFFVSLSEAHNYVSYMTKTSAVRAQIEPHGAAWKVVVRTDDEVRREEQRQEAAAIARASYLQKRRDYYMSLPIDELRVLWNNRNILNIEEDELNLLLPLLRHDLSIKSAPLLSAKVCPSCENVDDNCTCTRSWF